MATKYNDLCSLKAELVQRELQMLEKKGLQDIVLFNSIEHELRVKNNEVGK